MGPVAGLRRAPLLILAAVLGSLGTAPVAAADHGPPPWVSGPDVESPLEAAAAQAISDLIVKRPVQVRCHGDQEWEAANAALGWDASRVAGFAWIDGTVAELSPDTCLHLDGFWNDGAAEKRCRRTFTVFAPPAPAHIRTKVRVRVNGRWRTRISTVKVLRDASELVPVREQRLARCAEFPQRMHAVQTLAHEAFHLAGIRGEAEADCYAMQSLGVVGIWLGADPAFAAEMLGWMWSWYESHQVTRPSEYVSPDCHEDGALDLTPGDGRWP
jgi:hypothetical protein